MVLAPLWAAGVEELLGGSFSWKPVQVLCRLRAGWGPGCAGECAGAVCYPSPPSHGNKPDLRCSTGGHLEGMLCAPASCRNVAYFGVFHHHYAASPAAPAALNSSPALPSPAQLTSLWYLCLTRRGLPAARTSQAGQDGPARFQSKRCGRMKLYF